MSEAEISWSSYAIADVVTDILPLLFPVPLVWQLQLTISKKISVLLVFLLGSLSTAIGITRMVVLLYFTYGTSDGYRDLLDTISTALIWSLTEASVAIIASCLPSIRPLVHRSSASEARGQSSTKSLRHSRSKGTEGVIKQPALEAFDRIDDRQSLTRKLER
ncbi:hypothetical protein N7467_008704, partial [Penicillium canescens]